MLGCMHVFWVQNWLPNTVSHVLLYFLKKATKYQPNITSSSPKLWFLESFCALKNDEVPKEILLTGLCLSIFSGNLKRKFKNTKIRKHNISVQNNDLITYHIFSDELHATFKSESKKEKCHPHVIMRLNFPFKSLWGSLRISKGF